MCENTEEDLMELWSALVGKDGKALVSALLLSDEDLKKFIEMGEKISEKASPLEDR